MTEGLWLADGIVVELHTEDLPTIVVPNTRDRLRMGFGTILFLCEVARFNAEGQALPLEALETNSDLLHLLRQLLTLGVLVKGDKREQRSANMLSLLEWATLRMSQVGVCFTPELPSGRQALHQFQVPSSTPSRTLPEPAGLEEVSLWDILTTRRSGRAGPKRTIALTALSALLSYSMRIQRAARDTFGEISYRPVASGGARHPIEIFVAALRVSGLEEGIYHYNPLLHQLTPVGTSASTAVTLSQITLTSLGDIPDVLPAITLFFAAVPARTACIYKDMALALIMKDVGCITQQVYLLVQALGLTGCAIGTVEPTAIEQGLRLNITQEAFVGGFVIW